ILERHAKVDAIVFFMPLPPWNVFKMQVTLPSPPAAKVIVMGGSGFSTFMPKNHYSGYFTNQLLSVLIVGRIQSAPDQIAEPKTPRERFHNQYQIFTPENSESLPD